MRHQYKGQPGELKAELQRLEQIRQHAQGNSSQRNNLIGLGVSLITLIVIMFLL